MKRRVALGAVAAALAAPWRGPSPTPFPRGQ